jgi:uncharacterized protein
MLCPAEYRAISVRTVAFSTDVVVMSAVCQSAPPYVRRSMNNVAFFAIHCDDVERARRFYGAVFDWKFEAWGPPGFYLVHTGTDDAPGIAGAIQERHDHGGGDTAPAAGRRMQGFECTISVADVGETKRRLVEHGATITYDEVEIPTVGTLVQFLDTEGNVCNAMQYLTPP